MIPKQEKRTLGEQLPERDVEVERKVAESIVEIGREKCADVAWGS